MYFIVSFFELTSGKEIHVLPKTIESGIVSGDDAYKLITLPD